MGGKPTRFGTKTFDEIVARAIARIPVEIRRHLDNILISVLPRPDDEMLVEAGFSPGETLFGLYTGVPLTERSITEPSLYPDVIHIFQEPLEAACATHEELVEEIEITVAHEIAHAVGLSEEDLERLGYG